MSYIKAGLWYYRFEVKECDEKSVSWSLHITDLESVYESLTAGSFADMCSAEAEISPIEISEPDQLKEYIQVVVSNLPPVLDRISSQQLENTKQIIVEDDEGLFRWDFHFTRLDAKERLDITRKIVLDYSSQCAKFKYKLESAEKLLVEKDYHIKNLLELVKPSKYVARRYKKALEEYKVID